jgi:hypothetical protein
MIMWKRIMTMAACILLCSGAVLAQGTPDGETPAEESVCDDLVYATPGLYGLCVAFCEAQDCEPDYNADDPFEHCTPASLKLLDQYNRIKEPTDPSMPCLRVPCPCYDEEDLAAFVPPYAECRYNWRGVQDLLSDGPEWASIRIDSRPFFQRCIYRFAGRTTFFWGLSQTEADSCREVLTGFMDANQYQCTVVNDYR